jgi:hypothetical protein
MSRMACAWSSLKPNCLIRLSRASAVRDARIRAMTSSRMSSALSKPSRMCGARLGLRQVVLRPAGDHFLAVLDEVQQHALEAEQRGSPSTSASSDMPNVCCSGVSLNRSPSTPRVHRARQLDDDAHPRAVRLVAQVGDALQPAVAHQLGDALDELLLFVWYGSSVTMMRLRLRLISSICALACMVMLPRPVGIRLGDGTSSRSALLALSPNSDRRRRPSGSRDRG